MGAEPAPPRGAAVRASGTLAAAAPARGAAGAGPRRTAAILPAGAAAPPAPSENCEAADGQERDSHQHLHFAQLEAHCTSRTPSASSCPATAHLGPVARLAVLAGGNGVVLKLRAARLLHPVAIQPLQGARAGVLASAGRLMHRPAGAVTCWCRDML